LLYCFDVPPPPLHLVRGFSRVSLPDYFSLFFLLDVGGSTFWVHSPLLFSLSILVFDGVFPPDFQNSCVQISLFSFPLLLFLFDSLAPKPIFAIRNPLAGPYMVHPPLPPHVTLDNRTVMTMQNHFLASQVLFIAFNSSFGEPSRPAPFCSF